MNGFVIDASVAIKWVVQEPGTNDALQLRTTNLAAPELIVAECCNILWKKHRLQELTAPEARYASSLLQAADIDLVPMRQLMSAALDLAVALNHPAYDCLYMALGAAWGWAVVTADDRLRVKVQKASLTVQVVTIAEAVRRTAVRPH